jgi:ribosomal protein L1
MKKENKINTEQLEEYIKSQKDSFRQHQRDLPFGEKMQIAFSLAERDNSLRRAVLLPKNKKKDWK